MDDGRAKIILKSENELIAIYKDAYIRLLERIQYNNVRNIDNRHLKALLADVKSILTGLSKDTKSWIEENTPKIYQVGVDIATDEFAKAGLSGSFAKINRSAVEILSADMFNDLTMGINNTSASLQNQLRKIALQSVQNRLILGQSTNQSASEMYNSMVKNGLTSLKDRQGKRWDILTYSTMIIRTKTREMVTRGTVNTMIMAGEKYEDELLFDLVRISEHRGSCPICMPFQGKVYSISGRNKDYPKLTKFTPYHPNCRHVTTPFFERLYKGDVSELRKFSVGD